MQNKSYFAINTLAPKSDNTTVYFKKVTGAKSDGFVVVDGQGVFVIDIGKGGDREVIDFLVSLRSKWLGDHVSEEGKEAKLEVVLIISHAHPDHMAALPLLLDDRRFCVTEIYAPSRSYLSHDVEGALPPLVRYENKLEALCADLEERGHSAKGITRMPYGKAHTVKLDSSNAFLKIYPSHIDWSEDLPSDREGFKFILTNNSPTYKDRPLNGYTNGILNGNSLWVKVMRGECSVLITGDQRASDEMLGSMIRHYGEAEFDCDVLKIPHHGESNYPPYLISVADPKFTVFTTSYETATPDTVKLCKERGCTSFYTCDGNLFFTMDGHSITASGITSR